MRRDSSILFSLAFPGIEPRRTQRTRSCFTQGLDWVCMSDLGKLLVLVGRLSHLREWCSCWWDGPTSLWGGFPETLSIGEEHYLLFSSGYIDPGECCAFGCALFDWALPALTGGLEQEQLTQRSEASDRIVRPTLGRL